MKKKKNEGRLEGERGRELPVYNLTRSPLTAALYYLNAWNRLGCPREPLRGTEPIWYATIHFHGADSLRYRIWAEIQWVNKSPILYGFRASAGVIRYSLERIKRKIIISTILSRLRQYHEYAGTWNRLSSRRMVRGQIYWFRSLNLWHK